MQERDPGLGDLQSSLCFLLSRTPQTKTAHVPRSHDQETPPGGGTGSPALACAVPLAPGDRLTSPAAHKGLGVTAGPTPQSQQGQLWGGSVWPSSPVGSEHLRDARLSPSGRAGSREPAVETHAARTSWRAGARSPAQERGWAGPSVPSRTRSAGVRARGLPAHTFV